MLVARVIRSRGSLGVVSQAVGPALQGYTVSGLYIQGVNFFSILGLAIKSLVRLP